MNESKSPIGELIADAVAHVVLVDTFHDAVDPAYRDNVLAGVLTEWARGV